MPRVICNESWCRYWSEDGCVAEEIRVFFDGKYEGECQTRDDYSNAPEYQVPFWMRKQDRYCNEVKIALRGKRLAYRERIFYTRDKVTADELFAVVDEETGICIGTYADLEERYDDLLRFEKIVKKLEDLPEMKE